MKVLSWRCHYCLSCVWWCRSTFLQYFCISSLHLIPGLPPYILPVYGVQTVIIVGLIYHVDDIIIFYSTRVPVFSLARNELKTDSNYRCTRLTAYWCTRLIIVLHIPSLLRVVSRQVPFSRFNCCHDVFYFCVFSDIFPIFLSISDARRISFISAFLPLSKWLLSIHCTYDNIIIPSVVFNFGSNMIHCVSFRIHSTLAMLPIKSGERRAILYGGEFNSSQVILVSTGQWW